MSTHDTRFRTLQLLTSAVYTLSFSPHTPKMAIALSVRPNRFIAGGRPGGSTQSRLPSAIDMLSSNHRPLFTRRPLAPLLRASSRADDSAPLEMSVENALKLLGVSEGASFDDILRAKNSVIAACKDDPQAIAQVLTEIKAFVIKC